MISSNVFIDLWILLIFQVSDVAHGPLVLSFPPKELSLLQTRGAEDQFLPIWLQNMMISSY